LRKPRAGPVCTITVKAALQLGQSNDAARKNSLTNERY
jgi:hypothetical protein